MNKRSERAAEQMRQLPAMRAELQGMIAEIERLVHLMRAANEPSTLVIRFSDVFVRGGKISDPTATQALRDETHAGRTLRRDIAALTQAILYRQYEIDRIEAALASVND